MARGGGGRRLTLTDRGISSPVYGAGLLNGVKANYAPPQAGFRRSEAIAHRYKNGEPQFVHVRPSALLVAMMAQ